MSLYTSYISTNDKPPVVLIEISCFSFINPSVLRYFVPTIALSLLRTPNTNQPNCKLCKFASLLIAEKYCPILSLSKSLFASLNSTISFS